MRSTTYNLSIYQSLLLLVAKLSHEGSITDGRTTSYRTIRNRSIGRQSLIDVTYTLDVDRPSQPTNSWLM